MIILDQTDLKLSQISKNKMSPRGISDSHVRELVTLMKTNPDMLNAHPILVRFREGAYEIVDGHHRHAAAVMAGLDSIPATIVEMEDVEAAYELIRANAHLNLDLMAYGSHFLAMQQGFGVSQTEYAKHIGKSSAYVCQAVSALKVYDRLPENLKDVVNALLSEQVITGYHLVALATAPEENLPELIELISDPDDPISVKRLEAIIKDAFGTKRERREESESPRVREPRPEPEIDPTVDAYELAKSWILSLTVLFSDIAPGLSADQRNELLTLIDDAVSRLA